MLHLLGALLVAVGGAVAGLSAAEQLRRRERALGELIRGLTMLDRELKLGGLNLEQVFRRLSPSLLPPVGDMFQSCADALTQRNGRSFRSIWHDAVWSCCRLGPECCLAADRLGDSLGRCDRAEQSCAIAAVCSQLNAQRELLTEQRRSKGRVYQAVGLSGGAFLAILLL